MEANTSNAVNNRMEFLRIENGYIPRKPLIAILIIVSYIIITNFSIPIINTVVVIAVLGLALYWPFEEAIALYPLILIYFGYTFMPMNTYIPIAFDNTTFEKFYIIVIGMKCILQYKRLKLNYSIIWAICTSLICLFHFNITDCVYLFCVGIVFINFKSDLVKQNFLAALIVVLITVFPYHAINMNKNISNYVGGINLIGWRIGQFRGVRDPNNFALYSNIAVCGLLFTDYFGKKAKRILLITFTIGVLITISFSGIITLAALYFVSMFIYKKQGVSNVKYFGLKVSGIGLIIILLLFGRPIVSLLVNSNIDFISQVGNRIDNVFVAFQTGNLDSATSYRTYYWRLYQNAFSGLDEMGKLFGDRFYLNNLVADIGNGSHNAYLDYSFNYGIIGLVIYVLCAVSNFISDVKSRNTFGICAVIIILVNLYFRSVSGSLLFIPLFI